MNEKHKRDERAHKAQKGKRMNLNTAYRAQNSISNIYTQAASLLTSPGVATKTTQVHHRQAANPNGIDETIEVNERMTAFKADELIRVMILLAGEKEKLGKAISEAKRKLEIDIDAECGANTIRRDLASRLKKLLALEKRERKVRGSDFLLNAEGNQVPYSYFVDETIEPDFDRGMVLEAMRAAAAKADEVSEALDLAEVTTEVDYELPFNPNDTFNSIVEDLLALEQ